MKTKKKTAVQIKQEELEKVRVKVIAGLSIVELLKIVGEKVAGLEARISVLESDVDYYRSKTEEDYGPSF